MAAGKKEGSKKASKKSALKAVAVETAETETLPRWDLEKWFGYSDPFDAKLDSEMTALEEKCKNFVKEFDGKLDTKLYESIVAYEDIDKVLTNVLTYVMLSSDTQLANDKMSQRKAMLMQRYSGFQANYLTFFGLQLADLDDAAVEVRPMHSPQLELGFPSSNEYRPVAKDGAQSERLPIVAQAFQTISIPCV